jgi:23S rRNA (uracil1939-C5)-methyltransferase
MTPVWQSKTPSQTFGSVSVLQSPGAFLQATKHGESVMTAFIKYHFKTKKHILDLFCGCGALSLPLYDTAKIDAYDSDETQVNALIAATDRQRVSATIRNLFKQPVSDFSNYDGIIIDPPRAGALEQFKSMASNTDLPVISVSCNPLTFARDAKILAQAGYAFKELLPIDQFRWSHHVEIAGFFRKS